MIVDYDKYFFDFTNYVAENSKCLSKKVGAIIVNGDNKIISIGYNGPPRGVNPCNEWPDFNLKYGTVGSDIKQCPRLLSGYKSGEGMEYCPAAHAEANAINFAAYSGISVKGSTMFMNCMIPCKNCLSAIINSGIEEIVVTGYDYYDTISEYILKSSKLKVRLYSLPK